MSTKMQIYRDMAALAIAMTSVLPTAGHAASQVSGFGEEGYTLSVILEPGVTSVLLTVSNCDLVLEGCVTKLQDYKGKPITYKLVGGKATFENGTKQISVVFNGTIFLPRIIAGPVGDQSFLTISDYKSNSYEAIRVATVSAGSIGRLVSLFGSSSPYILSSYEQQALVNEDMIENSDTAPVRGTQVGTGISTKSVCIRTPLGPGVVKWGISNPKSYGFSVAPETSKTLIWASGSSQNVDAVYKKSWGCGTAYKIPDSCTATFTSSSYSACCNYAMTLLGHTVRKINTMGSDVDGKYFPDCPL